MENPFSWDYLTAPLSETPTFGPFSIFYLVLFAATFLASAYIYATAEKRWGSHRVKRETWRKIAETFMWITAVGLIFFLVRALRFPILTFEKRIWLYLAFLVYLGAAAYWGHYLRTTYQLRLAAFERERERRRYMSAQTGRRRRRVAR